MKPSLQSFRWNNIKNHPFLIVLFLNLLLAFTAFGKDVLLAKYLGTSEVADAFTLAYFIPDTIGNNLVASALGVVCIPVFTRLMKSKKRDILRDVTMKLLIVTFMISCFLMIILLFLGKPFIQYLGNGLSESMIQLTYHYFVLLLPIVVLNSIILIGASLLQSNQHFLVPAIGPVLFNLFFFLSLAFCLMVGLDQEKGGYVLSLSVTFATIAYLIFTWVPIRLKKNSTNIKMTRATVYLKAIGQYFISYFFILLFSQSVLFVERSLASQLEEGAISGLNYAYRLSQFPIWVVVSSITTVILPFLSKAFSNKQLNQVNNYMYRSLGMVLFISLFSSLVLFFFREPIVTLLFKRGAFTDQSVQITSNILAGYSLSIAGQSISLVCIRYYVAKRIMKIPIIILFFSTVCSILFDILCVPIWGVSTLGYGAMMGSIVSCSLFLFAISKEWKLAIGSRVKYGNH